MAYRILDLFCGAGGAAMGYHRAGFEVFGVDIKFQPRYPFGFLEANALDFAAGIIDAWKPHAIHASPPCQDYSVTKNIRGGKTSYPRLIGPVRDLLKQTGLPYVIENVPTPELSDPVMLCGSMFSLVAQWHGDQVYLQRHRGFEANFPLPAPPCNHSIGVRAVTVAGHGRPDVDPRRGAYFAGRGYAQLCRDVMGGIEWMNRDELCESIPPAYTEYVGNALRQHLETTSNRENACQ